MESAIVTDLRTRIDQLTNSVAKEIALEILNRAVADGENGYLLSGLDTTLSLSAVGTEVQGTQYLIIPHSGGRDPASREGVHHAATAARAKRAMPPQMLARSYPGAYKVRLDAVAGQSYSLLVTPRSASLGPGALLGPIGGMLRPASNENAGAFELRVAGKGGVRWIAMTLNSRFPCHPRAVALTCRYRMGGNLARVGRRSWDSLPRARRAEAEAEERVMAGRSGNRGYLRLATPAIWIGSSTRGHADK